MTDRSSNENVTRLFAEKREKEYQRLYAHLCGITDAIHSHLNDSQQEKGMVLQKILEASMWLKMAWDIEKQIALGDQVKGIVLTDKQTGKEVLRAGDTSGEKLPQ